MCSPICPFGKVWIGSDMQHRLIDASPLLPTELQFLRHRTINPSLGTYPSIFPPRFTLEQLPLSSQYDKKEVAIINTSC
jgi:hypothetical protein